MPALLARVGKNYYSRASSAGSLPLSVPFASCLLPLSVLDLSMQMLDILGAYMGQHAIVPERSSLGPLRVMRFSSILLYALIWPRQEKEIGDSYSFFS